MIAKDKKGLADFQKSFNDNGIAIPRVGIEKFKIPMRFQHSGDLVLGHDVNASMFIALAREKTGVNMSRFCSILQEEAMEAVVDQAFLHKVLERFQKELRDFPDEPLIPYAELGLQFSYSTKQTSLKSGKWGWQYYPVKITGTSSKDEGLSLNLEVEYQYSSTCPCSLALARQYQEDFSAGLTDEGKGVATPHAQRSKATVSCRINPHSNFFLEDLLHLLKEAIPTETQSFVKRIDEQAFSVINGSNPMLAEDVARRISQTLDREKYILAWQCKVEHFESLHNHNAIAYIKSLSR